MVGGHGPWGALPPSRRGFTWRATAVPFRPHGSFSVFPCCCCQIAFNTTSGIAYFFNDTLQLGQPGFVWANPRIPQYTFNAVITNTTTNHTEVAVWNFIAIYIGQQMRVNITGNRPLVLLSRCVRVGQRGVCLLLVGKFSTCFRER